ncbi:malonate decarboxylase holo-ACP synthase [Lactiplantibacillus plantarum]|uniref:malonate decarboxylase holo-ACP synthase n=1 Tax=Lactiplantibacillus plantarum TaxID=1590 RepID=UPI003C161D25
MVQVAPHTLIRLDPVSLITDVEQPEWAQAMLNESPYVIVRRGSQADRIPVGLRGYQKSQRLGAWITPDQIAETVTPHQALGLLQHLAPERAALPAFQKLTALLPLLAGFEWGVGGSLQFELVTDLKMARAVSDVDVIMTRPEVPLTVSEAQDLIAELKVIAGAHADIQVVHVQAGFSLEEFAQNRADSILMKTSHGPVLTEDPWHFEEA